MPTPRSGLVKRQSVQGTLPRLPISIQEIGHSCANVLSGHVLDRGSGEPVHSFRIRIRPRRGGLAGTEEQERDVLCDDSDGRFLVGGLAPDIYELTVQAVGYEEARILVPLWESDARGHRLNVLLGGRGVVEGTVRREYWGPGVAGVLIGALDAKGDPVRNETGSPAQATSDQDGFFRLTGLPLGPVRLYVLGEPHRVEPDAVVEVEAGATLRGLSIYILGKGELRIQTMTADGMPVMGANVSVVTVTGFSRAMFERETDQNGLAEFGSVLAGPCEVVVWETPRYRLWRDRILVVRGEVTEVKVRLQERSIGGFRLAGRIACGGVPMGGVFIFVYGEGDSSCRVQSGEDGWFEVRGLSEGLKTVCIEIPRADGYWDRRSREVEVGPTCASELEIDLPTDSVSGHVYTELGDLPVRGALVIAEQEDPAHAAETGRHETESDEHGWYLLPFLSEGSYKVRVEWRGGERGDVRSLEAHVRVRAGERPIENFRFPAGGGVAIHVLDPLGRQVENARVILMPRRLSNAEGFDQSIQLVLRSDGTHSAEFVAPGSYVARASCCGFSSALSDLFEVRAGEETTVDLSLDPACGIRVRFDGPPFCEQALYSISLVDSSGRDFGADRCRSEGVFPDGGHGIVYWLAQGQYSLRATLVGYQEAQVELNVGADPFQDVVVVVRKL
jgi:hypothetical protein